MTPIKQTEASNEAPRFSDLGIDPKILAILERQGFETPTPIQHKVVPTGIEGKDIIGIAQTGTGKTLAFGIPIIQRILTQGALALILLPTRELALQVHETFDKVGGPLGIKAAVLIGGEPIGRQIRNLKYKPDVVIATPGRLIDHLEQGTIKLDYVTILVLDEADHMFDIGFMPQIKEIVKQVPKERQTMLFSATMPEAIARLAIEHMALPLRIEVAPAGTAAEKVEQEMVVVERRSKFSLLAKIIGEHPGEPVIVFTRTKHGAKNVAEDLRNVGVTSAEIHSNRSLGQRREALDGFKRHKYQVLVATDIAARGIDVKDIAVVVNYDLPEQAEDYVHRIGRTGRAGKAGKAISFATPDQKRDIMDIEKLMKKPIPTRSHEGAAMSSYSSSSRPSYRGGFSGGRGRGGFSGGRSGGYQGSRPQASASAGGGFSRGPKRSGGFNSKYPRPLKTDKSTTKSIGTGYRRVFRKGAM
ncbi:MAG: DEAD/DEAH box helicase [Candidatus Taylorbacteria bacterium]|nr:DEAD/DEAH box helicase [Candidatus Taylorbacteria bacterium]